MIGFNEALSIFNPAIDIKKFANILSIHDAKQFAGQTHHRSTDKVKSKIHNNLAPETVFVTKAAQELSVEKEQRGSFSTSELKPYYHNPYLLERLSVALNLSLTKTKNNPKIRELSFSTSYIHRVA
jgi:hypothetical protein